MAAGLFQLCGTRAARAWTPPPALRACSYTSPDIASNAVCCRSASRALSLFLPLAARSTPFLVLAGSGAGGGLQGSWRLSLKPQPQRTRYIPQQTGAQRIARYVSHQHSLSGLLGTAPSRQNSGIVEHFATWRAMDTFTTWRQHLLLGLLASHGSNTGIPALVMRLPWRLPLATAVYHRLMAAMVLAPRWKCPSAASGAAGGRGSAGCLCRLGGCFACLVAPLGR
jgi:hypothetical protein